MWQKLPLCVVLREVLTNCPTVKSEGGMGRIKRVQQTELVECSRIASLGNSSSTKSDAHQLLLAEVSVELTRIQGGQVVFHILVGLSAHES